MTKKFLCPFCNSNFVLTDDTLTESTISSGKFIKDETHFPSQVKVKLPDDRIHVSFFACPNCENTTIKFLGIGSQFKNRYLLFNPDSPAKVMPKYIPHPIIQDYEEACKIVNLSPKASATLSRRCLQGMIRDYWKISKGTLVEEIKFIESKVDPETKDVLHSLRKLGNIGAHPEKDINLIVDIEPDEAQQLILFLEYLFEEWYIKTHNRKNMLQKIKDIGKKKDDERKNQ